MALVRGPILAWVGWLAIERQFLKLRISFTFTRSGRVGLGSGRGAALSGRLPCVRISQRALASTLDPFSPGFYASGACIGAGGEGLGMRGAASLIDQAIDSTFDSQNLCQTLVKHSLIRI